MTQTITIPNPFAKISLKQVVQRVKYFLNNNPTGYFDHKVALTSKAWKQAVEQHITEDACILFTEFDGNIDHLSETTQKVIAEVAPEANAVRLYDNNKRPSLQDIVETLERILDTDLIELKITK